MYLLKTNSPAFQAMSGPMAKQRFEHGIPYPEVPVGTEHCFEEIIPDAELTTSEAQEASETVEANEDAAAGEEVSKKRRNTNKRNKS